MLALHMKLVICEKPSVARDLAKTLGATQNRRTHYETKGLRIAWCFGHMCELEEPSHYSEAWKRWSFESLPMVPNHFDLRVKKDVKEHWKALSKLLNDQSTTEIVNACDAGREGELIFRYVMQQAGCNKPIWRFWVSSMTPEAISQGWANLKPGSDYDALSDAARSRSEADWLVGLNATRAMTCMVRKAGGDQLLSVGRVQTPTLALIVNRDHVIDNFQPEPFWRVEAHFHSLKEGEKDKVWIGKWFQGRINAREGKSGEVAKDERISTKADAEMIGAAIANQVGQITHAKRKRVPVSSRCECVLLRVLKSPKES